MKRKFQAYFLLSVVTLLLAGTPAFAAFELNNYARLWMTNGIGVEPAETQTTFALNEQPWLYIRFFGDVDANEKSEEALRQPSGHGTAAARLTNLS